MHTSSEGSLQVRLAPCRISLAHPPALSALHPPGTMWWRDGGGNFTVPVPGPRAQGGDRSQGFDDELRCGPPAAAAGCEEGSAFL